jgi:hypothetical protein
MEDADVPPLPPPEDDDRIIHPPPKPKTREDQLRDLLDELRTARRELSELIPARAFFASEAAAEAGPAFAFEVAESVLGAACSRAETAENLRTDPPAFASKPFMRKLGLAGADAHNVVWTAALIRRGVSLYAGFTDEPPDRFEEVVRADLDAWADERARTVRRLEREAAAVVRLLDRGSARKQTAKLLPGDGRDERIAKYERHLHSLLTSTLHELERLQARREGQSVPPPAVADVNVSVDPGPG